MASDLPPIHVTSDRQVRNFLEITKTHEVRLCVSSFSQMRTVSAVRRRFSFRIFKSTKTLFVATSRVSGCQWKVRASVKHGTKTFWVTKYVAPHTCSIPENHSAETMYSESIVICARNGERISGRRATEVYY
ncbi:hypothetical protein F2Q68_00009066 [Brassica cretica]|uniref:Transposase MuDR plant domain-containing protein n=1 Tax=Brassica cretica TaxID=69181 RepID=A0A8S9KN55_BRACR|nr:hypothetical protein F2Q68_00009066 [Brassica cretica]